MKNAVTLIYLLSVLACSYSINIHHMDHELLTLPQNVSVFYVCDIDALKVHGNAFYQSFSQ